MRRVLVGVLRFVLAAAMLAGACVAWAGAATQFSVVVTGTPTAGTPVTVTVTALDAANATDTAYAGTVHFTTTATGTTTLPADSTLTNGVGVFSATFTQAGGPWTVTASDTVTTSITGTSGSFSVVAGPLAVFFVSTGAVTTANVPIGAVVYPFDAFGNFAVLPLFTSVTVHVTSTDPFAVLPADFSFSVLAPFQVTLRSPGYQRITVTDTADPSIKGTSIQILVLPATVTHFTLSAPANATAGTPFPFTVTADDSGGNAVISYAGTVHFTSSDGLAVLPGDVTLTNGVGTFSAALGSAGSSSITATDTGNASITGSTAPISVAPGPATRFAVSAPASTTANTGLGVTVTALDAIGNIATGYAGTVHFTSTDGAATLPLDQALLSGVGTFAATLRTAGTQSIVATDTVSASIAGTSNPITVAPGAVTHLVMSAPATATPGTPFNITVTARDASNNTVSAYAGTVHFTSSDGAAILPADATLVAGLGTFSATLGTIGSQTLSATDATTPSITGASAPIAVVVTTFSGPSATGSGIVTASFTGGGIACTFAGPQLIALAAVPTSPPPGIAFPHGLFDFRTTGCTPGSTLAFTLTYPTALPAGTRYWKYGPRTGVPAGWYVLPATVTGNTVTFSITDGGLGDDDLAANGGLVDQGGPGVPLSAGTIKTVPTLSRPALALLALFLAGLAMLRMRGSRSRDSA